MDEQSEVHEEEQSENNDNSLPNDYSPKQAEDGVKVLFQILEKTKKKSLFEDEGDYIQMRVSSIRIPKVRKKNYRFTLPNGFLRETSEVCLFVRGCPTDGKDYEKTVRHYKDMLAEAGVTCIAEVISMSQLMQEYKTYEMRRRLAARFDMFLADSAVNNWLHNILGKTFHSCRKQPTPVKMRPVNLKERLEKTLLKSTMVITTGSHYSLKIGHTKQSVEQICQNIEAVLKELRNSFPGKWKNVRSLTLWTQDSLFVPIYFSFAHPNSVGIPKQPQLPHRKMIPEEEDELTTLPDGYTVKVLPTGVVKVRGKKADGTIGWLNDHELSELGELDPLCDDDDAYDNDQGDELMSDSEENKVGNVEQNNDHYFSDSEEDEAGVQAAEEEYLKELKADLVIKNGKRKPGESDSSKRKIAMQGNFTTVKKSKSIDNPKTKHSDIWKVDVISSSGKSGDKHGKSVKNVNTSWKVFEVTHETETNNCNAPKASIKSGQEKVKNRSTPINNKAKAFTSEFGTKGKVSGNKLGKKKKHRPEK